MNSLTKGEQTRRHIVKVAAQLIYQQGFNHTGLAQIIKQANVSKGSFYFHFSDKQALGLAVIDLYAEQFSAQLALHLRHPELNALEKFEAFHHCYFDIFSSNTFSYGCPIGNLVQELSALCPVFKQKLSAMIDKMCREFERLIIQGVAEELFQAPPDPAQLASFIVDSWEGALLRMKSTGSAEPLQRWYLFSRQLLIH